MLFVVLLVMVTALKPSQIIQHRGSDNSLRNAKLHNTEIYKSFPVEKYRNDVIINCKSFEDVEVMFYTGLNAYHWWPTEQVFDSLTSLGYTFAAFKNHTNQHLPEYISRSPYVEIIDREIK